MSIRIVFASSSGSLAVYENGGRRVIQATARMTREPVFPSFLNRDYLFQRTDQNMSVCHFVGVRDNMRNDEIRNADDMIHLTYSPSLVTEAQGGILVIDGSVATWRSLIDLLSHSGATLSVINLEVMKPSPAFSSRASRL
jgi:hypothetical protein